MLHRRSQNTLWTGYRHVVDNLRQKEVLIQLLHSQEVPYVNEG